MFIVKEILQATKGKLINEGVPDSLIIKGVSTDTRKVRKGELFIALKGERFDGHDFIRKAIKKGVRAVIVSRPVSAPCVILVDDTQKALGDIASAYRDKLKTCIVGITGSNGKTTTKDMIAHILSKQYAVAKTQETENNHIGVPLTLLNITSHRYAIIEMGTNSPGEINYLAKIIRPQIGIITNIGPSHLTGLKTEKNILNEKSKLFDHLAGSSCAIINKDDAYLSALKIRHKVLTYGIKNEKCDFHAGDINAKNDSTEFILNKKHRIKLPVLGEHNIYNALAAICACSALGIDVAPAARALLNFKGPKMRFEIRNFNRIKIINDAYNSNPNSMQAALKTFGALKIMGKRIVVTADMLELGKEAASLHYKVGHIIAESNIDLLITVGALSAHVAQGAKDSGMNNGSVKGFIDQKAAARYLVKISSPGDAILIKGSRSMKMEELIECFITCSTR
ncbi:MAG: UDP-N-acetylmuramoyl-tripeptide--D-alanyl-D-alanine ligase [Candidatus Omnitrophica bacterium]|nr:UDP-N-acetylmuramoyl-tripeptide--D-alanyl-D-alanine ligase [Candidatus Omnitrophota bacterium]